MEIKIVVPLSMTVMVMTVVNSACDWIKVSDIIQGQMVVVVAGLQVSCVDDFCLVVISRKAPL